MPKITLNYDNRPQIELLLNSDFITKYNLEKLVDLVLFPNGEHSITFYQPNPITIPFKFPNFQNYDEPFLRAFIELFNSVLKLNELEKHADQLLFLANTFVKADRERYKEICKDQVLRRRGRLLLNFIKVPLPQYTIETIQDAFFDHLEPFEKDELLVIYLSMLSGKPESTFENEEGKIDYSTIDKDLRNKVIKHIVARFNIHIELPCNDALKNSTHSNYLVVSKEIHIDFSSAKSGKKLPFSEEDPDQSAKFNTFIVEALFQEQKDHNTKFYLALLEHDFFSCEYDKLNDTTKDKTDSHNIFNLEQLYSCLMNFLETEKLLFVNAPTLTKRKRNNFIYKYLILVGLPLNLSDEWNTATSIKQIEERLSNFKFELSEKPLYANAKFDDCFKNLTHKNKIIKKY